MQSSATAMTPEASRLDGVSTEIHGPGPLVPRSFYRAAMSSLPLVVVGTLAATGTIAVPAHAVPAHAVPASTGNAPHTQHASPAAAQANHGVTAMNDTFAALDVAGSTITTPAVRTTVSGVAHRYIVTSGDTVSGIADRLGLRTSTILELNGLTADSIIHPNQTLRLTASSSSSSGSSSSSTPKHAASKTSESTVRSHVVVAGDTVSGIADRFGLSTSKLLALNGLKSTSTIFPDQVIRLSAKASATSDSSASSESSGPSQTTKPASASSAATVHVVRSGDTMTAIAQRTGVSLNALLSKNSLSLGSIIYPGQVVVIPRSKAAATAEREGVASIDMTGETRGNAETIIRAGRDVGVSDFGIVIALAAAMQESGLRNLDHGDRDSLGVFQQRSSTGWGTSEQVRDVERASLAFFGGAGNPNPGVTRGLLDIPGWKDMTLSQAAQAVQISGYPNYYAKWEQIARSWLNELG